MSADDEFTVSYGLSIEDRKRMLAVIRSAPKRQLATAAKVSTRTIPTTLAAAKLRRLFEVASSLDDEKQKGLADDEGFVRWLAQQVRERGLKKVAELLQYDAANVVKVIAGKRRLSTKLRKGIGEQMDLEGHGSA